MSNPRPPEFSKDEIRVICDTLKHSDGHDVAARIDKYHFMKHFNYRLYQTCATDKRRYNELLGCGKK